MIYSICGNTIFFLREIGDKQIAFSIFFQTGRIFIFISLYKMWGIIILEEFRTACELLTSIHLIFYKIKLILIEVTFSL